MTFAVIFDLNGVIIDDMPYHKLAWVEFAKRRGFELPLEEFDAKYNGRPNREIFPLLLNRPVEETEVTLFETEKEALYRELFLPYRAPAPGFMEFLAILKRISIPWSSATGAPPVNVDFIVDPLTIRSAFGAIIDSSHVTRGKPDPEVFLRAAECLGVEPRKCIVIEDGILGIVAARKAEMKVIGVTTTHKATELEDADFCVASFLELTLERLEALFES